MSTPSAMTSAASSRSEFVIDPLGLSMEITSVAISTGNATRQTAGGMILDSENHTPPAPSAAAS